MPTSTTISNRRLFLASTSAAGLAATTTWGQSQAGRAATDQVVIGVMGMSRGRSLAVSFGKQPNVKVKYVCDIDQTRADSAVRLIEGGVKQKPYAVSDFRRILDDADVDVLVCAAPNHWHAPATILACAANKHVYVEKPCSHNPYEGELMVQAARKHKRAVQMGTQRRSGPGTQLAIQKLRDGVIGRVYLAKSWYNSARGPIGKGQAVNPPATFDYELWQGPAPRRPYLSYEKMGRHYHWHWFWHWGNGELGNNGVHTLDLCRWGLNVDYPRRISSSGGRYHFQDDQQTPDTHTVCFEFDDRQQITWDGRSCNKHPASGFVTFYGDSGTLELDSNGSHRIFDRLDNQVDQFSSPSQGDMEHIANFLEAIRTDNPQVLNSEIEIGHKSTMLCHLGNISHRTGRTLHCDSSNGHIVDDADAMRLWKREYAPGWEPQI